MSGINTSGALLMAQHNLTRADGVVASAMQKLATGLRINRGADDPAGLITSENLRAALASLEAESRSMERSDAVANVADGALAEVSGLLADAQGAAVAMANTAGMSDAERAAHQMEMDSAMQSVDRIAATTTFNGQRVFGADMTLHAGDASLELAGFSAPSGTDAEALSDAAAMIASMRGEIGAFQANAIEPQLRSNAATMENTMGANSLIRDTDFAAEVANLARARVLQASALGVLALAGSEPLGAAEMLG